LSRSRDPEAAIWQAARDLVQNAAWKRLQDLAAVNIAERWQRAQTMTEREDLHAELRALKGLTECLIKLGNKITRMQP
jgi:ubiquinone biosynthesis protein UbiJ